ncbi:MAG: DegT/DnrJ/EryC1/StrS aminotransferase family protein [Candidatus Omnitrophica bacterium]|nr:DegT/DnrJ/EryC1/StrS aminotransferase family protein [Candidatus Omnitrophota bacterium]
MKISQSKPSIGREELSSVNKVFQSGWLGMGKQVFEFENLLKKLFKRKYVIAVNSGTNAIHIALDSIWLRKNDEVIVPSLTFAGSVQPIILCGAKPVFCDVDKDTLNMSEELIRRKVTRKTKAIIVVHYGGLPCDMDRILKLAKEKHLRIIEDAAHAFGSIYKEKLVGSFGDITCFSFDPIKNITCGEGGAVILDDKKTADLIIKKRILGIDKDTWNRYKHKRSWFYSVKERGYRYHMSNINAAIGLVQLKKMDFFISQRQKIATRYDNALRKINGIQIIERDYRKVAPFNYTVMAEKRNNLMEFLQNSGITTGINYIPNHLQPLFKSKAAKLPNTEYLYRHIISLPIYSGMKIKDADYVISRIKEFYNRKKVTKKVIEQNMP